MYTSELINKTKTDFYSKDFGKTNRNVKKMWKLLTQLQL